MPSVHGHGGLDFLMGHDWEFDILASAAIKRAINNYAYGNTHFTLVLPYLKAKYRDNEKEFLDYYDEVEVCYESSIAHPKAANQVRNRSMIDRSDLVVCCVQHNSEGAYHTLQYAEKQGKRIINISDEE